MKPDLMKAKSVETRFDALDAIGSALKRGRIGFAEATRLRDLARSGRFEEINEHLAPRAPNRQP